MWPFKKKAKGYLGKIVTGKRKMCKPCKIVFTPRQEEKAEVISTELVRACKELAVTHPMGCCGLAANQLGYNLRVICILKGKAWKVYINPEIVVPNVAGNRKQWKTEGCLSFPNKPLNVERMRKIVAVSDNHDSELLTGREAEAFQHEVDHLDGVTPY